ncbi:MAG TPA: hypothetical protein DDZ81_12245 [Acetobacteraceae bacterium]|nr:hypothetical protein [Acetobacteraceae bacterium]
MIIVRFAVSAVAAVSGLFLLGLAFYGQPAVYLRQARDQWNVIMDRPAEDPAQEPAADPNADRAARLQQEVARLREELAVSQQAASKPEAPAIPAPIEPVAPPKPPETAAAPPAPVPAPAPAAPPPTPAPIREEPKAQAAAEPQPIMPEPPMSKQPPSQAIEVPERPVAAVEPRPVKVEPPKPPPSVPAKPVVAQRPVPAPPVLPQSPPRQEADDTQSVLARLRQGTVPPQVETAPLRDTTPSAPSLSAPSLSAPSSSAPSPSLPGLVAARAALSSGRVESARRLLQEVQLQLVFRPVTPDGDPTPSAGRGAANVAHALDALSANDIGLAQRYVAVAVDDLSGKQTSPPIQQSVRRGSGYAPAYPPR